MLRLLIAVTAVGFLGACGSDGRSTPVVAEPVVAAPEISGLSDQVSDANTTAGPIEFSISDNDTTPDALLVTASADNEALVSEVSLGGTGGSRTVSVSPVEDGTGSATVTIRVEDAGGEVTEAAFAVEFVLIATSFDSFVRDVFSDAPNSEPRSVNARSFDESQSDFDDLVM